MEATLIKVGRGDDRRAGGQRKVSKSKWETALERMEAERDHWRAQSQQRTEQLRTAAKEVVRLLGIDCL